MYPSKIWGMSEMSRKSTAEYIAAKRKRYLYASKAKRSQILDEVQETTGFTRKYVTKPLPSHKCMIACRNS